MRQQDLVLAVVGRGVPVRVMVRDVDLHLHLANNEDVVLAVRSENVKDNKHHVRNVRLLDSASSTP